MYAAKLIDLMMNFIIYPSIVIIDTIVEQRFINILLTKAVNDLQICRLTHTAKTIMKIIEEKASK